MQLVANRWEDGRSRQRVVATLGRVDELRASGELEALLSSGARFSEAVMLLEAHGRGEAPQVHAYRVGPALVFERLWEETGCRAVVEELLRGRAFAFPVERAVFLTVLHRLFDPASDRAADQWRRHYRIDGVDELELHHLYRAMAWLGEELPPGQQVGATSFRHAAGRT